MEMIFDFTSLEAFLNGDPDGLVIEQLLSSGSMFYTYDMILSDLYAERSHKVGSAAANQEIEYLRSLFVIWTYTAFDAETIEIQQIYGLPYTAAVCVAISKQLVCPVITASHYSFDSIVENEVCGILFTR